MLMRFFVFVLGFFGWVVFTASTAYSLLWNEYIWTALIFVVFMSWVAIKGLEALENIPVKK